MGVDPEIQKALEEIGTLQKEIDGLTEHASENILTVGKPHFDKRNEIISRIKDFWITVLVNHPQISLLIDDEEEDCLHFLTKMEVEEIDDIKSGYRIKFFFDPQNPFFTNGSLVKEFHLRGEPKSTSTDIDWKQGMDLTKGIPDSYLRRRRGIEPMNFFAWLADHGNPLSDRIAEVIKKDLWLNPLPYYLVPVIDGDGNDSNEDTDDDDADDEDGADKKEAPDEPQDDN